MALFIRSELMQWVNQFSQQKSYTLEQMNSIAYDLGKIIQGGDLFCLSAPLGGGKTTFVQLVGQAIGVSGIMASPTFNLYEKYNLTSQLSFYHFDLYRIETEFEFENLEFADIWESENAISMVEWPEKAESSLPKPHVLLRWDYPKDPMLDERLFYATVSGY